MMADLIHYVKTHAQTFSALPLTDVDGVILAQLAYVDFHALNRHRIHRLADLTDPLLIKDVVRLTWNAAANFNLLLTLQHSPRFRNIRWHDWIKSADLETEKQFCAVTFDLGPSTHYIAYRGTTATLTDWKEDFNMTFMRDIPSQRSALRYYQKQASRHPGTYFLGGHSKGGNLAVFTCLHSRGFLQNQIQRVFSVDGPGTKKPLPAAVQAKVTKFIPQASIIGLLLEPETGYQVVKSNAFGFRQHDPFTWEVNNASFALLTTTSRFSQLTQRSVSTWLSELDNATKKEFLDSLFSVLRATHYQDFRDMSANWEISVRLILKALSDTSPQVKHQWRTVTGQLIGTFFSGATETMKPQLKLPEVHLPALLRKKPLTKTK